VRERQFAIGTGRRQTGESAVMTECASADGFGRLTMCSRVIMTKRVPAHAAGTLVHPNIISATLDVRDLAFPIRPALSCGAIWSAARTSSSRGG